jgi:hypothetical protein
MPQTPLAAVVVEVAVLEAMVGTHQAAAEAAELLHLPPEQP